MRDPALQQKAVVSSSIRLHCKVINDSIDLFMASSMVTVFEQRFNYE